jgi:hypothetical protein
MAVLSIGTADIKRLCSIPASDTSQDSDVAALIAAEQVVLEYALDPAVLTASAGDSGLLATLTLGVAERMAGSYLEQVGRAPGYTDDFKIGGLDVSASRTDNLVQLGVRLTNQGQKRLEPFTRATRKVASDAVSAVGDGSSRIPTLAIVPTVSALGSVFEEGGR